MRLLSRLVGGLAALFRRNRVGADLDAELREFRASPRGVQAMVLMGKVKAPFRMPLVRILMMPQPRLSTIRPSPR